MYISYHLQAWLLIFGTFYIYTAYYNNMSRKLSINFEVFGRVQGVFFRKYTQQEAKKLGLKGWCMNTERGTVQGCMEGEEDKIQQMKQWLESTGSPQSKIEKAVFTGEKEVKNSQYSDFQIRR